MNRIVSTSLIAIGSFLLGGSLGLYFGGRECKDCNGVNVPCCVINNMYSSQEMKEILDSMPMDGDLPEGSPYLDLDEDDTSSPLELSGFQKGLEKYNQNVRSYLSQTNEHLVKEETLKQWVYETMSQEEALEEIMEQDKIDNSDITEPYIISIDAYLNEYEEYSKNTLSYYEGDDVLCDDRNEIITDVEDYVGEEALVSFGEGSDDENVVYIRNHRKSSDYEIVRENGSYEVDILGMDPRDVDDGYDDARKFFGLDEDREE